MKQVSYKSFTLLEVVISVSIMAMILTALIALVAMGGRTTLSSEKRLKAANLAQGTLESLRQIRDSKNKGSAGACYNFSVSGCYRVNDVHTCNPHNLVTGGLTCVEGDTNPLVQFLDENDEPTSTVNVARQLGPNNFGQWIKITQESANLNKIDVKVFWKENDKVRNIMASTYIVTGITW